MVKFRAAIIALALAVSSAAVAQEAGGIPPPPIDLPDISSYATPKGAKPLATGGGSIVLAAQLAPDTPALTAGLVWRVFSPEPGPDGKLPLIATAQGGVSEFDLPPGPYIVHAAFGRAGATKKVNIGTDGRTETLVLDAGGVRLDAVLTGGMRIPPGELKFSVFDAKEQANGTRALILPNVPANSIVRLNAGTYHVVSEYGDINASITADIVVEAGKLTEAVMEHAAAKVTLKLVREAGGEALADTSWAVLAGSGDIVREEVGAYSEMVLAEGAYTVIAKNREQLFQRDIVVKSGENQEIEVITTAQAPAAGQTAAPPEGESATP